MYNIGGSAASAIYIHALNDAMNPVDTRLTHIEITNSEFSNNGSTSGQGVALIIFPESSDLYNILLEGNVF